MNATSETKTGTSGSAEQQTFIVLGVLLQFLSTPEQINDRISVMHGTVPSGVVIPLHSHADPEIFYVLDGSLEVFQAEGPSEGWQTINAANVVSIPGNARHALRNPSPTSTTTITVTKQQLYSFSVSSHRHSIRTGLQHRQRRTRCSSSSAPHRGTNTGLHPLARMQRLASRSRSAMAPFACGGSRRKG